MDIFTAGQNKYLKLPVGLQHQQVIPFSFHSVRFGMPGVLIIDSCFGSCIAINNLSIGFLFFFFFFLVGCPEDVKNFIVGISLVIQWLRLHMLGSIPGQGTRSHIQQ